MTFLSVSTFHFKNPRHSKNPLETLPHAMFLNMPIIHKWVGISARQKMTYMYHVTDAIGEKCSQG